VKGHFHTPHSEVPRSSRSTEKNTVVKIPLGISNATGFSRTQELPRPIQKIWGHLSNLVAVAPSCWKFHLSVRDFISKGKLVEMSSLTALSRSDGKFQEFMTTFRPEYPPNELHWKLRRSSRIHPAEGNGTRALMGVASTSGIKLPPLGAFFQHGTSTFQKISDCQAYHLQGAPSGITFADESSDPMKHHVTTCDTR